MLLPKRLFGKIENKPAADVAAVADLINFRRSNFDDFMCELYASKFKVLMSILLIDITYDRIHLINASVIAIEDLLYEC